MAVMIPDNLPSRNAEGRQISEGERRVFAILRKLPDDCIVYYEPVVHDRHPDFIVILPEVGVLIVEVKGWYHANLKKCNSTMVTLMRDGQEVNQKHPGKQAFDYMCLAKERCETHRYADCLLRQGGTYQGRLVFPFGWMSVLSNINSTQLEKGPGEIAEIFPKTKTATRDQLTEWEACQPEELVATLRAYFDLRWLFPKLTPQQIDVIRSAIHPEIVLHETETGLAVLDLRQEDNARAIGSGHRVIYGVAGSGKTVLLIARAKFLADGSPDRRVLLLCYNKLLASHLRTAMGGYRNVAAMHFHKWGSQNGTEFCEDDDVYGERLLALLRNGARDFGRFDAVLIDECQDWPCSWFHCAKLALRDPEGGDLLIVGDGSQSLYRARNFTWADAGINARGRTINAKFDLDRNYRNTAEILRTAQPFATRPTRGQATDFFSDLALPVDPDRTVRNGPEPKIVELKNPRDECLYAATLVETWLRGGVEILGRRVPIAARDIGILYPRKPKARDDAMALLCERLNTFSSAVWLTAKEKPGSLQDEGVRMLTIKGSRGLQFRVVVLLWADLLPYQGKDERSELYVAMTRAEDVLVILHSGRSAYIDELRANQDATAA